ACYLFIVGFILFLLHYGLVALISPLICGVILFTYLFVLFNRQYFNRFNFGIATLFFFSILLAFLLSYYNLQNEDFNKERIANEVSQNRDLITEYRFEEIQNNIKQDPFFRKFFVSPFVSQKELLQRLNYIYFGGYLSKYNINSYAFNNEGRAIKTSDTISIAYFNKLIQEKAQPTLSPILNLIPKDDGKSFYLAIIPIEIEGQNTGQLVVELNPKTYHKENLYPELLIEEKTNPIAKQRNVNDYEYGIYKNDYLISQSGEYPFPYYFGVFNDVKHILTK
ncbi:MAG: hypothetical protein LRY27_00610, partial [Chitinophagales bacterium]|nr:hypothetical protein [Chitinophagales bacterium]